jgi:IclR family transcriptional regulator, acetate operon repressor
MRAVPAVKPRSNVAELGGDTPTLRLFALLEVMAERDQLFSLQGLVDETGLPKPTLHRMLQLLEGAGLLQREGDGRHYSTGVRLRRLAENLMLNSTYHGARHAVLRHLVEELGESCNITALSGNEVIYLDRVETAAPLRFYLHPGSRVPAHCSASGKLLLSQMTPAQRQRLLSHAPLESYTSRTLTKLETLEREFKRVARDGYALDNEEFLPGLLCVAVLVPVIADHPLARYARCPPRGPSAPSGGRAAPTGRSNLCVAVQAPMVRVNKERALGMLPALRRAAAALADIEEQAVPHAKRRA